MQLYNSYTRQKETFEPITPGYVGLYVCGPTVNGESHLGHARPYITFDVVGRWLRHLGYKVRYVRNITDAGHFEENDRTDNDRIGEKAKLEKLEPMELVHKYTSIFHRLMAAFNNMEPSIEPTATGHITEQIAMIQKIIAEGYAYEVNGSVYFDVKKYAAHHPYGTLSGRILDDLLETTRELEGQDEKREKVDFALWKAAPPQHIQRWPSPWGEGFPGWHIECSAMSAKYLGDRFDIHGGGMDLLFPHHESEIAQSTIAHGHAPVKYWMHNNMITINGKKMGRSYGNIIKLTELFSGNHPLLEQPYHPMVVRFYILQTHYRSTLDFSNEALQGSERAFKRLWEAYEALKTLTSEKPLLDIISIEKDRTQQAWIDSLSEQNSDSFTSLLTEFFNYAVDHTEFELDDKHDLGHTDSFMTSTNPDIAFWASRSFWSNRLNTLPDSEFDKFDSGLKEQRDDSDLRDNKRQVELFLDRASISYSFNRELFIHKSIKELTDFMNDDFNTAKVIGKMFQLVKIINGLKQGTITDPLSQDTLSLLKETFHTFLEDVLGLQPIVAGDDNEALAKVLSILIDIRKEAKVRKDFATSDAIRDRLLEAGVQLKDGKDGTVTYTIENA